MELRSERDIAALMQKFTVAGGGSTDFRPVFSYVNDLIERGELKILVAFVFYGWQGDLSENETGLSDGIFVFRGL